MPLPFSALRMTIAGLLALAIAMGVGRFAFTPLLPMMLGEGQLTISQGGMLAFLHFLGYGLGALSTARLIASPRKILFGSLLVIGIATIGMGLTESFALWMIFRWLCGLCSAFVLVLISNYIVKQLAEASHASMQGWVFSGVGAGISLVGLAVLAFMAADIGAMLAWQIVGVASFGAAIVACVLVAGAIPDEPPGSSKGAGPRVPLAWSVVIAYGTTGLGYIIPATYLPIMAQETVPSPLIYGWSWPVFGAAAFLSTVASAHLHTSFTNRQIWAAGQLVMAAGVLLPVLYPHIATVIAAGLCVGGTFMIITMAGMKEAHEIAPAYDVQRHIAVLTAAFALGQMIGPVLAGWVYDATRSFSPMLLITSIALAVTALVLARGAANREVVRT